MADRIQQGVPHTERCDSLRCRCYLDGLFARSGQELTWAGQMMCSSCGQHFEVGSHLLGSTTHVCPALIDGDV